VRPRQTAFRIAFALSRVKAGWPVGQACDVVGISIATFRRWQRKYEGLRPADVYRLRRLENENRKLKAQLAKLLGTGWRLRDPSLRGHADRAF
jgi:putative transposase